MKHYGVIVVIIILILIQKLCGSGLRTFNSKYHINNVETYINEEKIKVLKQLHDKNERLIMLLKKSIYNNEKNVKRLFNNWSGIIKEKELRMKKEVLAYNTNKGDKINICLTDPNTNKAILDINSMYFVFMHELAHVMTNDYSHNEEFWKNFRFLITFSIDNNLYKYVNYNKNPTLFCGYEINHTPYSD